MNKSISESFKNAIKNGTGQAILLLKENPSTDFDKYILHACTHNLAYDPQCEGSRAEYLFEILSLSRNNEKIISEIIRELNSPNKEYWDTQLLFDLIEIIAKHGNQEASKSIYQRYSNNLNSRFEFIETDALVTLDGLKGLEFVAEIQGKQLDLESDYWVDDYQLQVCKEYFPETSPEKFLKEKAYNNKYIKKYLAKIEEIESLREKGKKRSRKRSLSQLLQLIENGKPVPIIAGKWLSSDEVLKLANLLLHEKDEKKIQSYLRLLSRTEYPLDISNLLPFLSTDNDQIKFSALRILGNSKDHRIRKLIEDNYTNLTFLYEHLEFFRSNFLEKDIDKFCNILDTLKYEEDIHSFGMVIRDMMDENVFKNPRKLLNKLYLVNNCSICRESFIKRLISDQQLSKELLREMRYDCEPDIRKLANEYIKNANKSLQRKK